MAYLQMKIIFNYYGQQAMESTQEVALERRVGPGYLAKPCD